MSVDGRRELEAPADLVEELAAALGDGGSEANPDLVGRIVATDSAERAVDPLSLGLLILAVIGAVNDVADFRRNIGGALMRWRDRRRQVPGQQTEIDLRVRRADGTDEYHRLSGEMTDESLERLRDALADGLR